MGICPDYRNNVRSDHIFMGRQAKLWVGKRSHRKYDHNWIKKGKITILCQKGFPLNLQSLSIITKKFLTIRPLVLSGLSSEYLSTITSGAPVGRRTGGLPTGPYESLAATLILLQNGKGGGQIIPTT